MNVTRLDDRFQRGETDHRGAAAAPARPLPASPEAEQAVIGAVLLNNEVFHAIGPRLEVEHFSEEIHRRIWEVTSTMIRDGRIASPVTLKTFLGDAEVAEGVPMPRYLARLAAEACAPVNAPDYARLIVDLHGRRQLIAVADEMREQAYDPPAAMGVESIVDGTESALSQMRTQLAGSRGTRVSAGDAAADLLGLVDRIRAGDAPGTGVTTGIPDLDRDTGGMQPGTLWIIAGRVAMGKTIKGITLARAAAKSGAGTLLFPFEIRPRQAAARLLADLSYFPRKPLGYGQILKGEVDDEDRWRIDDAWRRLKTMPLVIDDASRATVASIASRVRSERDRMARDGIKLGVVILDYLKFIRATDRYAGQRYLEVGEISVGLKQIAIDFDVCVVLLAQVNRTMEQQQDKRPTLSSLRESGDLEADADVVAFVYRDAYYIEQSPEFRRNNDDALLAAIQAKDQLELIVAKNRTGPTRTHHLWCDVACSTIAAHARGGL